MDEYQEEGMSPDFSQCDGRAHVISSLTSLIVSLADIKDPELRAEGMALLQAGRASITPRKAKIKVIEGGKATVAGPKPL